MRNTPSVPRGRRVFRRLGRTAIAILAVLVLLVVGFLVYANMVMRGERPAAIDVWTNGAIKVVSTDHSIIMSPTSPGPDAGTGLVFIPGAKVDPYGYMFKLSGIVESEGVTVVITKPTLNLAFFDFRPISTFTDDAPAVSRWFVGGHSLGGVRACQLADPAVTHDPKIAGLVLFGSFCANDLSGTSLHVLSISGSDDGLSTPDKIVSAAPLLPGDAVFTQVKGANHASFGNYGIQPGDGTASISSADMRSEITRALTTFFG
jgi:hypothetical protein